MVSLGYLGDGCFEANAIITHHIIDRKREYLIDWRGYNSSEWKYVKEHEVSADLLK